MEQICRDKVASASLMREFGLVGEGAKCLFALKNCASSSDCRHREACHAMLYSIWQIDNSASPNAQI